MKLINKIKKLKKLKRKLVCLPAYSKPTGKILDRYCDILLVGDSLATAFYGMKNTKAIDLETMINHAISVKKNSKRSVLVFDMPFKTYRNFKEAKKNIKTVIKRTNCDAVKLESNGKNFNIIKNLVRSGIPVMGHIGYTPQYKKKFKVCGMEKKEEKKLIEEAKKNRKGRGFFFSLRVCSWKSCKKDNKPN